MRKILFPFEKLLLLFFYLELLYPLSLTIFVVTSLILFLLGVKLQGARPYTPLLLLIILLEIMQFPIGVLLFIIIAGFIAAACRIYDINVPLKGKYMVGHRYSYVKKDDGSGQLLTSIFYPTDEKGKRVQWVHHQNYNKVLYEIFYVDPNTKRIPFQIFKFLVSYIHKIWLPAEGQTRFFADPANENLGKVIIFSHGLGANLNAFSSFCCNWASQGYTVISISHQNDEVCVDFRSVSKDDLYVIKDYLFEKRNRDLYIRVKEMTFIFEKIVKGKLMDEIFKQKIQVKQIYLAGQSYGGATVLATKAHLNNLQKTQKNSIDTSIISGLIALDPWLFPFDDFMFNNLKGQNIFMINSQHFFEEVPKLYELEKLFSRLKDNNPKMQAFMIKKMDHLAQSDMAFTFGNILKLTGSIKCQQLSDRLMALNFLMTNNYFAKKSTQQIIKISEQFINQNKMNEKGVQVCEEYRVDSSLTERKNKDQ